MAHYQEHAENHKIARLEAELAAFKRQRDIAVAALERYCDDKCNAEYNPCAALEALKEIGEIK